MSIFKRLFGRKEKVTNGYEVSKSGYKKLCEDNIHLFEVARTFMLDYSQDFDDEAHKVEAMKEVMKYTSIPFAHPKTKEMTVLKRNFKRELKGIERGELRMEIVRVSNILLKYKEECGKLRDKQKR